MESSDAVPSRGQQNLAEEQTPEADAHGPCSSMRAPDDPTLADESCSDVTTRSDANWSENRGRSYVITVSSRSLKPRVRDLDEALARA